MWIVNIKNTDITGIVRSAFYKSLTQNNRFNSEGKIAYPNEDELDCVITLYKGESVFIPAGMGEVEILGAVTVIETRV